MSASNWKTDVGIHELNGLVKIQKGIDFFYEDVCVWSQKRWFSWVECGVLFQTRVDIHELEVSVLFQMGAYVQILETLEVGVRFKSDAHINILKILEVGIRYKAAPTSTF